MTASSLAIYVAQAEARSGRMPDLNKAILDYAPGPPPACIDKVGVSLDGRMSRLRRVRRDA